jgi:hypothetical protein
LRAIHRQHEHAKDKPWFAEVAHINIEEFPDRASALLAEKNAIQLERPLYNVMHNQRRNGGKNPAPERRHKSDILSGLNDQRRASNLRWIAYNDIKVSSYCENIKKLQRASPADFSEGVTIKTYQSSPPSDKEIAERIASYIYREDLATLEQQETYLASLESRREELAHIHSKLSIDIIEARIEAIKDLRRPSRQAMLIPAALFEILVVAAKRLIGLDCAIGQHT